LGHRSPRAPGGGKKKLDRQFAYIRATTPDALIAELRRGAPWDRLAIPDEEYLKVAVTTLLPQYYAQPPDESAGRILWDLAEALERRHGDGWLRDVLRTPHSRSAGEAFAALGRAVGMDETGDRTLGKNEVEKALATFRSIGSEPGALRAEYERLYTLQMLGGLAGCARSALLLQRSLRPHNYPWISTQTLIDDLSCQAWIGDFEKADRAAHAAERTAEESSYRVLLLRARGMYASVLAQFGDTSLAWRDNARGLAAYWDGDYPLLRAQHFVSELAFLAAQFDNIYSGAALARESVGIALLCGDEWYYAVALRRLAMAEVSAGLPGAQKHLDQAAKILATLPYGQWKRAVILEEMEIADLEARLGHPDDSLARLTAIEPQARLSEPIRRLGYYKQLGVLRLQRGELKEARMMLDGAIGIGASAHMPLSDADRVLWTRYLGQAYRARLECEVRMGASPDRSWALWSRYRAALFDGKRTAETVLKVTPAPGQALLSFAEMPSGLGIWLGTERGFSFRWLDTHDGTLRDAIGALVRGCSNNKTRGAVLRAQARQVSARLLDPAWDGELDRLRELVVESDGPVSKLPWPALVRPNGRYWCEDFAIRIRVGASSRPTAEPRSLLDPWVNALIVGAPTTAGNADLAPLPDAVEEAERIHSLFPRSMLLTGPAATLSNVKERIADTELFHFAGHGYGGEGGGLVLTGTSGGLALLTAAGIEGRDLSRCRLVVLSGCATGSGELGELGEPQSLVRAFLRAGAQEVVASSWNLDSAGASAWAREFYRAMLSGRPATESLQTAGAEIRRDGLYAHPYYWAGFEVFSGN
jgi:CHAT domain-containing protein